MADLAAAASAKIDSVLHVEEYYNPMDEIVLPEDIVSMPENIVTPEVTEEQKAQETVETEE